MYARQLIDRFMNLKNSGLLKGADGVGTLKDEKTAQTLKIYIKVEDDVIKEAKFKAFGCVAMLCILDCLVDLIKGKTIEECYQISIQDLENEVKELPCDAKNHLLLALSVLDLSIKDYIKKQEKLAKKLSTLND